MQLSRGSLLWLNVLGGVAVLGGYAHGLATNPLTRGALWGGVPEPLQPVYTLSMLLAAAGYFAFSYFVLLAVDPREVRIADRFGYGLFHALYALILLPSALWMPLTFAMIESPAPLLWCAIRLVLAAVAIGSIGLFAAIRAARPHASALAHRLALAGSAVFAFHTTVLDALLWPALFAA